MKYAMKMFLSTINHKVSNGIQSGSTEQTKKFEMGARFLAGVDVGVRRTNEAYGVR